MAKIKSLFLSILILTVLTSCSTGKKVETDIYSHYPENFAKLLKAQGGLDKWNLSNTLEFDLVNSEDSSTEHHIVDLKSRKVLVQGDSFKIGFDGSEVWVAPNKKAFAGKSARFYHNLFFYFFSIPYVLADPGINYQDDTVNLDGQNFSCIKATFNIGVGDSDKDFYKMIVDPQTNRLTSLLYTVTFYSGEVQERYNLLKYEDQQEINGLIFPGRLVGYKYENDSVKENRYEYTFRNISLKETVASDSLFAMPLMAEVDSLLKRETKAVK